MKADARDAFAQAGWIAFLVVCVVGVVFIVYTLLPT